AAGVPAAPASDPAGAVTAPVDQSGPAVVDDTVRAAVAERSDGDPLDLVLSLEEPATPHLAGRLDQLATWTKTFEHIPVAAVRLPLANLDALTRLDGVLAVYHDHPLQYFLKDSARLMNTARAWEELGVTGKGVTVAILDTGVDFTHPDLAPAMKANVKLPGFGEPLPTVPIEGLPNSDTTSGHGTHVAGDVASRGTASEGKYRGIAYNAGLVGIGAGEGLSLFTVLEGFDWLLENRDEFDIKAVNNSWGTGFTSWDPYSPVNLATKAVHDAGVVVVFANGNDGDEMSMNPYATAPWVIPVAAGSKDGQVASFSSAGIEADTVGFGFSHVDVAGETRKPLDMGIYHPAIAATGENVVSTRTFATVSPLTALPTDVQEGLTPTEMVRYTTLSGTSMAAPEAAGLVALILEAAPDLLPLQVRRVMQITARFIPGVPFHRQGYGYADASAAVELAQSLAGESPDEVRTRIEKLQAERDAQVLSTLAHPSHTYAWEDVAPTGAGTVTHKVNVPKGTARIKVATNGGTIPFVGGTNYDVTITDAAGRPVGTVSAGASSGTTVLDVDLTELEGEPPTFGEWTVDAFAAPSLTLPMSLPLVDDVLPKREISTLVSLFPPQEEPACDPLGTFIPSGTTAYSLQDDVSAGTPFPPRPDHTFVGPVPNGTLGTRTPPRRLAGTFGSVSTNLSPPLFTSAPLTEPLTVGGPATVELWVQGPSEAVTGVVSAQLIDLDGENRTVIAQSPPDVPLAAGASEPQVNKVEVPVPVPHTVPAGHQLALALDVTSVSTSSHTLFYDSDAFPSGVTVTTGKLDTTKACPDEGSEAASPTNPEPVPPPADPAEEPADEPAAPLVDDPDVLQPAVEMLPKVAAPVPPVVAALPPRRALNDLPALDQVSQERPELVAKIGAVQGQLDGGP
ncbi:MAG: S8 family serine peptidase, partial [Acidimicrobiia bacterium]